MSQKPAIPKGTRDFLPLETARRAYIFDTIRSVFKVYGYAPIETPSFELSSTLMGKYGEEGDKLIFRILRSGNFLHKTRLSVDHAALIDRDWDKLNAEERSMVARLGNELTEKALRYDLTVPFARFVVQHQNELSFPFKRYQIQPVWRADRPQKSRYQEFWQCDVDVVGSNSLLYEVELVQILDEALNKLRIPSFTIKINNRKILSGIAEVTGEEDKLIPITVAIDKLDKIGREGVEKELREKGLSEAAMQKIAPLFEMQGSNRERIEVMKSFLHGSETGQKGIEELTFVLDQIDLLGLEKAEVEFDVTLARGLNYYTGAIFEVKANGANVGSICGGGRYDDLTGLFGLKGLSGVGVSFGADRIYDVIEELNLFPEAIEKGLSLMFVNFGENEQQFVLPLLKKVRQAGIDAEIYPSAAKLQKQMKYANDRNTVYVALIGENEMQNGRIQLKNMNDGTQIECTIEELIEKLS